MVINLKCYCICYYCFLLLILNELKTNTFQCFHFEHPPCVCPCQQTACHRSGRGAPLAGAGVPRCESPGAASNWTCQVKYKMHYKKIVSFLISWLQISCIYVCKYEWKKSYLLSTVLNLTLHNNFFFNWSLCTICTFNLYLDCKWFWMFMFMLVCTINVFYLLSTA